MNTLPFRWDQVSPRLGPPFKKLYIGKLCLGSVSNKLVSKNEPAAFGYHCALPGVKRELMYNTLPTEAEAMQRCEQIASMWFAEIDKARS